MKEKVKLEWKCNTMALLNEIVDCGLNEKTGELF